VAAGGRYDQMLGRFGYQCPAVGFAFDVARALTVMEAQGVTVPLPGPDFFIVDSTPDKTAALSLARRLRDLGASVARDIVSRALPESLAYARNQRAGRVLVIGGARTREGEALVLDLATETERRVAVAEMLERPEQVFEDLSARVRGRGVSHA
jgi:ATP phosphoribosyltransferase regulatory subunit